MSEEDDALLSDEGIEQNDKGMGEGTISVKMRMLWSRDHRGGFAE